CRRHVKFAKPLHGFTVRTISSNLSWQCTASRTRAARKAVIRLLKGYFLRVVLGQEKLRRSDSAGWLSYCRTWNRLPCISNWTSKGGTGKMARPLKRWSKYSFVPPQQKRG